ncbi:hypothetical protein [Treponema bryantii]|jgi:hypothetical protein|nr:hypothetical protein [Treponema bryantii]
MRVSSTNTTVPDFSSVIACISNHVPFEYTLTSPGAESREFIKKITNEYLKQIHLEKYYNLLGLCMEEIISNSVKANIKRAYFITHNLNINNHDDYESGMKHFKEQGLSNIRDAKFVEEINKLGLYVKLSFNVENNCLYITARNNSVISKEEISRINKRLSMSENKSSEDIFMNSIDQTEGAGLGIIMIKKILSQISSIDECFRIRATDTETITELMILP